MPPPSSPNRPSPILQSLVLLSIYLLSVSLFPPTSPLPLAPSPTPYTSPSSPYAPSDTTTSPLSPPFSTPPPHHPFHSCRTAPAICSITASTPPPSSPNCPSPILQSLVLFSTYLLPASLFSSSRSLLLHLRLHRRRLYFSVVTMCTIGYSDITHFSKLSAIFLVLFAFGFLDILLSFLSYFLD